MVKMQFKKLIKSISETLNELARDFFFNVIASSIIMPKRIRTGIYNLGGMNIQTNLMGPRIFMGGNKITIGQNSYVNHNCFFDNMESIEIGRNCIIAMNVMFCTSTHAINDEINNFNNLLIDDDIKVGDTEGKRIVIEDNCWIGARATILPGVRIEKNCIIAAGAVVTKDCASNGLYAGVPAKRVKDISINLKERHVYAYH